MVKEEISMIKNVGKRIMQTAMIIGVLALIAGIIGWLYFITNSVTYWGENRALKEDDWMAWASLILGVVCYISSWRLYGFGQIVEDVRALRAKYAPEDVYMTYMSELVDRNALQDKTAPVINGWKCSCGRVNEDYISTCCCGVAKTQAVSVDDE